MSTLHIEPAELREIGHVLEQNAQDAMDLALQIKRANANLEIAWQGGKAESVTGELDTLQRALLDRIEDLYTYTRILSRQADAWDELDQRWQKQIRGD